MSKPKSNPIFNSHIIALLFILALVSAFASFAMDAMGEARDTKTLSFMASIPASAQLHHLTSGDYDRFCERVAQEAYLSSVEIDSYQCDSTRTSYQVISELSTGEKLCVSSSSASSQPQTCQ